MITLVRQLTLIIVATTGFYALLAYILHHTLTKKINTTFLSISAEFLKSGLVFAGTMALSWWIVDYQNIKSLLPVSSHIARSTLAEILALPISVSLWAIGSASLLLVVIKKLFFIWTSRPIPGIISLGLSLGCAFTGLSAIYTGLSGTKKQIAQFGVLVQKTSLYVNIGLISIIGLLIAIVVISAYRTSPPSDILN